MERNYKPRKCMTSEEIKEVRKALEKKYEETIQEAEFIKKRIAYLEQLLYKQNAEIEEERREQLRKEYRKRLIRINQIDDWLDPDRVTGARIEIEEEEDDDEPILIELIDLTK